MWPRDPALHHRHGDLDRPEYYGNVYERHAQVRHTPPSDLPRPQVGSR